jgi:D-amino-acid dehydrogenase
MRVAVLGAGITGISTAYYLTELGHTVSIIDGASRVGDGATGGNGCQLSYSFTDAYASPSLLRKFPGQLLGFDSAIRVRPSISLGLARWGLAVLSQCTSRKSRENTIAVLKLAIRSAALMDEIRESVPIEFTFRSAGKLVLLSSDHEKQSARKSSALKASHGGKLEVIDFPEACEIEPGLNQFRKPYAGAIWSEDDAVGCAKKFCEGMSAWLSTSRDVQVRLNEKIETIVTRDGKLERVETSRGSLEPDAVVVCLGAQSSEFLRPLGVRANIYPVRGYSVTLPCGKTPTRTSITDLESKIVFTRMESKVRIAGLADIVGFNSENDSSRIRDLLEMAHSLAPEIADYVSHPNCGWGGFRPMTPNSQPLVGPSSIKGLFLNTGHGMLGWTLACATGFEVARHVGAK